MPFVFRSPSVLIGVFFLASCSIPGLPSFGAASDDRRDSSGRLAFAVVGDLPYNTDQRIALEQFITPKIDRDANLSFAIHLGDYKAGRRSPCTETKLKEHADWMAARALPVFYTPGDNDWTDCDRSANKPARSSLGELKRIRDVLFDPPPDVPEGLNARWQTGAPENAMWSSEDVVFATIHVTGSNNGRGEGKDCSRGFRPKCDSTQALVEDAANREQLGFEWINQTFARAAAESADAVVISMHADLTAGKRDLSACTDDNPIRCNAFALVKSRLVDGAKEFDKPVLVIHGDTSPYCFDREFGGADAPKLWRLNAAGDFVLIDAVRVAVDPMDNNQLFKAVGFQSNLTPGTC